MVCAIMHACVSAPVGLYAYVCACMHTRVYTLMCIHMYVRGFTHMRVPIEHLEHLGPVASLLWAARYDFHVGAGLDGTRNLQPSDSEALCAMDGPAGCGG